MGVVDGTTLTYDPAPPDGAPTTLQSGQLVKFFSSSPFVVKSQDKSHPFYLSGHMTGMFTATTIYGTGDPEFVNVIPPDQYLESYVFMTDPTMSNTHLVLVRPKVNGQFQDVTLDCSGTVTSWRPVGDGSRYETAWVDLVAGGESVSGCTNGRHEIRSVAPFGLTVWGWDLTVSYAYPAGARLRLLNDVHIPPLPH
jgi:hypothetical protein